MSLVLAALMVVAPAAAVPATPAVLPTCSWNRPGQNPFIGDVVAAVDAYTDISAPVRERLKARMAVRNYDEVVSIRRDAIVGQARYGAAITGMHFGAGQICGTVNRAQWAGNAQERGLVYCESGHCILVPTVCRNVSRITRQDVAAADAAAPTRVAGVAGSSGGTSGGGGGMSAPGPGDGLAAPAAGSSATAAAAGSPGSTSFSQAAASPSATSPYGAGGYDSLATGGNAAGGAASANAGSWAAATGGAGIVLGVHDATLAPHQLSALPPENPGQLNAGRPPARHLPGSAVGSVTGPVSSLPTDSSRAVSPVPEPASALLLLAGLGWLTRWTVRRSAPR